MEIAQARIIDPTTAKRAAEYIERSGKAKTQMEKAVEAVKKYPGLTAVELTRHTTLD